MINVSTLQYSPLQFGLAISTAHSIPFCTRCVTPTSKQLSRECFEWTLLRRTKMNSTKMEHKDVIMEEPEEHIQPQPLTKTIHRHLGSQETLNHKVLSLISLSSFPTRKILEEIITKPKFSQ